MQFDVYCDEANPDVFTSLRPRAPHLMIGSLWLPKELRDEIKTQIKHLREQHDTWGEIKWTKISHSRKDFYIALIDLFFSYGDDFRFRCIAVDRSQFNIALHGNDGELGFYKFYYQLLHHWILDFNQYEIYCDAKSNRDPKRLSVLSRCLSRANLSADIVNVQFLPSRELVLIQLCDLLLGAASSRMNNTLRPGGPKAMVVERLERALGHKLGPTRKSEEKFNIFQIRLQGGW